MKFRFAFLGSPQSLLALAVSLAVLVSTPGLAFASLRNSRVGSRVVAPQISPAPLELQLVAAKATVVANGVLLEWRTNGAADNLGFNVYRLEGERRTRVNREIIPGAVFAPNVSGVARGGAAYSCFDAGAAGDATYYVESVSLQGTTKLQGSITPVAGRDRLAQSRITSETPGPVLSSERSFPSEAGQANVPGGTIADQWAIVSQPGLKIGIRKDGWYRVTQAQMQAAGFNPAVDIRNLRLFVDAQEVAINTSQARGRFGSGDYIEFYGRGLDTPTSDTRIYYLLAGAIPGKRVQSEIQLDGGPMVLPAPAATPLALPPAGAPAASPGPQLFGPIFYGSVERMMSALTEPLAGPRRVAANDNGNTAPAPTAAAQMFQGPLDSPPDALAAPVAGPPQPDSARDLKANPSEAIASPVRPLVVSKPAATRSAAPRVSNRKKPVLKRLKKRNRNQLRRPPKPMRNHAPATPTVNPANFDCTVERKDRSVYFVSVLNGDQENFFGQVIVFNSTNPVSQTISTPNPDFAAGGTARLEIALQGVNLVSHQISVEFNGVVVGSFSFFGLDPAAGGHPVKTFDIPVSQLQNGANTIRFILPGGGDVSLVDYVRISYPHLFRADGGSARFRLRGTDAVQVDGFATPEVRLIDYTDPLNVSVTRPVSAPGVSGFAIDVPAGNPPTKAPRLLYAIAAGQFDQPASLKLNQPSTLNASTNAADFLIISHENFSASLEPLRLARQNQGMTAKLVDVEDVYDEFGFGLHGPQAIRDFLAYARTHWATSPRYVVFAGDASLDPRNYQNAGNFDFVPTKLLDATFNETASDDWLADFDNDGIADVAVGRLPVRTVAEASLVVSKILNFIPANVPQAALLVADDPGVSFDFETATDNVQALLPASMPVQRVNIRTEPSTAQATTDIVNGFNSGKAIVNYSGHGNVDVWTGASIFTTDNASALTNGHLLPFVVVMDCLNGYFQDPLLLSLSEAFLKAPNGGAVAAFASSGLTTTFGQRQMELQLYATLYGSPPMAVGDAIKIAKAASGDRDVRTTWIYFGDPSIKIR
jgi:hypothetical protein